MGERQPLVDVLGKIRDISSLINESIDAAEPNGRQERIFCAVTDLKTYLEGFGTNPMIEYPEIDNAITGLNTAMGRLQVAFSHQKGEAKEKFQEALGYIQQSQELVEQAYKNPSY